ncbi:MAG: hypothetical protein ACREL7_03665 [Longimicrobiales bacterium]
MAHPLRFRHAMGVPSSLAMLSLLGILTTATGAESQTVVLRGRVIALGRTLPDTFRIRLTGLGDPRMLGGGEFEIEIPSTTSEVEVQTTDRNWSIVYPPSGRLAVPRGDVRAVVVVGEPVEQTITRALAERVRASEQLLAANGLQAERLGGVEEGIQQILAKLDLREEDLRDETVRKQRQAEAYPEIAATIERYVAEAKDLHTTLLLTAPIVVDGDFTIRNNAYLGIVEAVNSYSAAYDSIDSRRARFETAIETFWNEGPLLRRDLAGFLDSVLEPLHRSRIFAMNPDLITLQTGIQAGRGNRNFVEAYQRIAATAAAMTPELAQLEARAARILEQLRPE